METHPPPTKGAQQPPLFGPCLLWPSQAAGWMTMQLNWYAGTPRPGNIVFDADPALPALKGHGSRTFGPCLLWPNGWMDQDATWYGDRSRPRRSCVRWDTSPKGKGHNNQPPSFPRTFIFHGRSYQLLLSTCLFTYELCNDLQKKILNGN